MADENSSRSNLPEQPPFGLGGAGRLQPRPNQPRFELPNELPSFVPEELQRQPTPLLSIPLGQVATPLAIDTAPNLLAPPDEGPRDYQRPDALVLDDAAKALAGDPWIDAFQLEVSVDDGTATVEGIVPTEDQLTRIEMILSGVFGVRNVSLEGLIVSKGIEAPEGTEEADEESRGTDNHVEPSRPGEVN